MENSLKYKIGFVEDDETGENIIIKWQAASGGPLQETTLNNIINDNNSIATGILTFTVNLANLGTSGDYIRVYSIQSTIST